MIYYLLFLFIFNLAVFEFKKKIISSDYVYREVLKKYIFLCFITVILIFFCGFRYYVGYDYQSYRDIYFRTEGFDFFDFDFGIFFQVQVYLTRLIGVGFEGFIFTTALVAILIKIYVIRKLSPLIFLSIALYFSQEYLARDFSNIRQGVAISFIALSFYFFVERKKYSSYFFCVLAVFAHATAIVFLLFYICDYLKKILDVKLISFLLVFAVFFGQLITSDDIVKVFGLIQFEYLAKKIADYSSRSEYSSEIGMSFGSLQRLFIFFAFLALEKQLKVFKFYYSLRLISWIGLMIFFTFNSFEIIAARASYYFRFFDIIIYSMLPFAFKGNRYKFLIIIFILVYSLQGLYREVSRSNVFVPYVSIFQGEKI